MEIAGWCINTNWGEQYQACVRGEHTSWRTFCEDRANIPKDSLVACCCYGLVPISKMDDHLETLKHLKKLERRKEHDRERARRQLKKRQQDIVTCECGSIIQRHTMKKHVRTRKHREICGEN